MKKIDKTILLLSKESEWCEKVYEYLREHFHFVIHIAGNWGDPLPKNIMFLLTDVDYIISYLCPWILPKKILDQAKEHAINFHPAPPKYPGIGGYNYAIWNGDEDYGVMVHEMAEKVDSGQIYNVVYFSMDDDATVKSLKEESMCMLFGLFQDTMMDVIDQGDIDDQNVEDGWKWHTPPYTRADFQKNCEIRVHEFDRDYIEKQVRAFYFPGARDYPYFLINGKKYKVTPIEEEKL